MQSRSAFMLLISLSQYSWLSGHFQLNDLSHSRPSAWLVQQMGAMAAHQINPLQPGPAELLFRKTQRLRASRYLIPVLSTIPVCLVKVSASNLAELCSDALVCSVAEIFPLGLNRCVAPAHTSDYLADWLQRSL